jgi:hypothetical protein
VAHRLYLFDANAIIEAVRVGVWNVLTGALELHTVATCFAECTQGDRFSSGYVVVDEASLSRISSVHSVSDTDVASVLLMDRAEALDRGELELFAHAMTLSIDDVWVICSPDLASIKFAVTSGVGDRLISLEDAMDTAGARPMVSLRSHFTSKWLSTERTKVMLGIR